MKELNCKEIQSIGLEILRAFDEFANKHGLTYFLSGGTLLGAVRHKGFIPWDDDVDLMMPRPDYEYLIHHFHHERFHLSCCELERDYCSFQARIWDTRTILVWGKEFAHEKRIGAFIDIFPMDGFPDSEFLTKIFLMRVKARRFLSSEKVRAGYKKEEKFITIKKLVMPFVRKDANTYVRRMAQFAQSYKYDSSNYVGVIGTGAHLFREKNPKSAYQTTVYLDFEGMKFPAPVGYDGYLRQLYGDYMKLPPEDQRVSEHTFKLYWKE